MYPNLKIILHVDNFFSAILIFMSIRAGLALWSVKPKALQIAKKYFLIYLGYNVLCLILPLFAGLPSSLFYKLMEAMFIGFIRSLVYFGIWFTYLNSKRVKDVYESVVDKNKIVIPEDSENILL